MYTLLGIFKLLILFPYMGINVTGLLMEVSLQINSLVILLASFLVLGMALFIGLLQHKEQTSRYLIILLFLNCVIAWIFVSMQEGWVTSKPMVAWVSLQMLQGPFLYFYVRSLVHLEFRWRLQDSYHFIPAVCFAWLWLLQVQDPFLLSVSCPDAGMCSQQYESRFVHRLATWLSIFIYGYGALRLLPIYMNRMKHHYSALQGLKLTWLKCLIWCFIVLAAMAVLLDVLRYSGVSSWLYGGVLQAWGPIILIVFIAGFSMRQRHISLQMQADHLSLFYQPEPVQSELRNTDDASLKQSNEAAAQVDVPQQKYQSSGLDEHLAAQLWRALTELMEQQQWYLKHGLKVADLANELAVPVNYVSQAINGYGEQSFYDWVNQYRLNHAVRLLADGELKVVDIAEASGFASQSSFYEHFKHTYKMTPKQYQKTL